MGSRILTSFSVWGMILFLTGAMLTATNNLLSRQGNEFQRFSAIAVGLAMWLFVLASSFWLYVSMLKIRQEEAEEDTTESPSTHDIESGSDHRDSKYLREPFCVGVKAAALRLLLGLWRNLSSMGQMINLCWLAGSGIFLVAAYAQRMGVPSNAEVHLWGLGGIAFLLGGMLAVPSTYIDSLRFQMAMRSLQAEICALVATNVAFFGGTDQDVSNRFQGCSQEQSNEKEDLCQNSKSLASENDTGLNSMQSGAMVDDSSVCTGSTAQSQDLMIRGLSNKETSFRDLDTEPVPAACAKPQPNKEEELTQESRIVSVVPEQEVDRDSRLQAQQLPNRTKASDSEDLACTTSASARDASTDLNKEVSSTDFDPELGHASLPALAGDWFVPDQRRQSNDETSKLKESSSSFACLGNFNWTCDPTCRKREVGDLDTSSTEGIPPRR